MMRVARLVLVLCFLGGIARAEEPVVEVEFEETQAIPGQPLTLRVTVLVPTWMPKPVVFPSFEAPNLRVRLPEGATGPVSRTINGETWSGVSRRMQVTPMIPGQFEIPAQSLTVIWAEPGKTEPLVTEVSVEPIPVEGIVPEGAEGLDPFIAAEGLSLSSEVSDAQMPLKAGDSVTLTIVAEVEGASPIFLPQLLPPIAINGVAAYPSEPVLEETENRGKLAGTRTETVSLVAESGGSGAVPTVSLDWYNLKTQTVETASVDGFDVSVDAPSAAVQNVSLQWVALALLGVLAAGFLMWQVIRRLVPPLRAYKEARRLRIEASDGYAFEQAKRAVASKDMGQSLHWLDIWATRCPQDPREVEPLKSALSALGAARYGPEKSREDAAWRQMLTALRTARANMRQDTGSAPTLPPLNPRGMSA